MSTFQSPIDPLPATKALSESLNNLDAAVASAFALLPTETNIKQGTVNYAVDTGLANAYVVALPHTPSGYADGLQVDFRPLATNTGAATINVSPLGVKPIKNASGSALSPGDLTVGIPATLRYSTATGFFHVAPNSAVSAVAAAASATTATTQADIAIIKANEAAASASAAANTVSSPATSTSALVVGTGPLALVTQPGKYMVVGMTINIARTSDPADTRMGGIITAYNSATGDLSVTVSVSQGNGTFADWTISLSAPIAQAISKGRLFNLSN